MDSKGLLKRFVEGDPVKNFTTLRRIVTFLIIAPYKYFYLLTYLPISVVLLFMVLIGPLVSAMVNKFGMREVTIVGSVMASAFFVISSFSTSINMMLVTYGIMGGSFVRFLVPISCRPRFIQRRQPAATVLYFTFYRILTFKVFKIYRILTFKVFKRFTGVVLEELFWVIIADSKVIREGTS